MILFKWKTRLADMVNAAADSAFKLIDNARCFRAYIWYRPAKDGQWGEIFIINEDGDHDAELVLADPRDLNGSMTREQMWYRINDAAQQMLILGAPEND